MNAYFTEEGSVEAVNARMGPNINPRLAAMMAALVKHLHAFAKEVEPTQEEWEIGIDFLTKTGQICSRERQEFILLSDTLGFSMLVDAINNRRPRARPKTRSSARSMSMARRCDRWAPTSRSTAKARAASSRAA